MAACAAALDPVQADAYLPAQEQFNSIISHLRETSRKTHSELEQFLNADGREMLRRIFQGYLDERGPGAVTEPSSMRMDESIRISVFIPGHFRRSLEKSLSIAKATAGAASKVCIRLTPS